MSSYEDNYANTEHEGANDEGVKAGRPLNERRHGAWSTGWSLMSCGFVQVYIGGCAKRCGQACNRGG